MNKNALESEIVKLINLFNEKRFDEVIDFTSAILANNKNIPILNNLLGASYAGLNNHKEAIIHYNNALKNDPNNYELLCNLGKSQTALNLDEEAIISFNNSIKSNEKNFDPYFNLGLIFHKKNLFSKSIYNYDKALEFKPNLAEAYYNKGMVFSDQGKNKEAIDSFLNALKINKDYYKALNNLGVSYININNFDNAIEVLKKALKINQNYTHALNNLGAAYLAKKEHSAALQNFTKAYDLDNNMINAGIQKFYLKKRVCDWSDNDELQLLLKKTLDSSNQVAPWQCLAMEDNPKNHLVRAKNFSKKFNLKDKNISVYNNSKIRIGYFAADFHQHPGMVNMAGIFDNHDKNKFEIYGFYYGIIRKDKMHYRVKKNFDKFFYINDLSDIEINDLSRKHKIDIAIHRAGHTDKARSNIFSYRLAPIQINYLGYPGTTGQDGIDYIISDSFVIPAGHEKYYSENIINLTKCYYPKDNTRKISNKKFHRKDFNIPKDAFVFCSFNNTYKISSDEFNIWMNLLIKIKNSFLILLTNNESMKKNIVLHATKRNLDSSRIKFLDYIDYEDHLARHSIADLFLDTFNYNAHTSAVDSLWAGLPILTKVGNSFSSRICGSILNSLELDELITYDKKEYEDRAFDIASNKKKLKEIKFKISEHKVSNNFFDTKKYTKNLEKAYELVHNLRVKDGKFKSIII